MILSYKNKWGGNKNICLTTRFKKKMNNILDLQPIEEVKIGCCQLSQEKSPLLKSPIAEPKAMVPTTGLTNSRKDFSQR